MVAKLKAVFCVLVIYCGRSDPVSAAEGVASRASSCGFGYEILVSRMEALEDQLIRLMNQLDQNQNDKFSKLGQSFERHLKNSEDGINQQIKLMMDNQNRLEKTVEGVVVPKLNQLSEQFSQLDSDSKDRFEVTKAEINKQNESSKIPSMLTEIQHVMRYNFNVVYYNLKSFNTSVKTLPVRSCADEPTKKSGSYWLQPFLDEAPFEGYCEQEKFGGGWLAIQYRFNGSVDFYRNWEEYKHGFGQPDGEFWLGLQTMHRLTKANKYTLLVEVESFDGKYGYAMYDRFEIGSEEEKFSLKQLGSYNGTAGDSLKVHKGMSFTTKDSDNDTDAGNCASIYKGAWWYKNCHASNLNGPYENESTVSNTWYYLENKVKGLKMSRMMIKEA